METELADPSDEKAVLVIGAAGLDMVGRLKAQPKEEAFQGGRSNEAEIQTFFGGVARNVAENLARLGQPVKLITAVGDDFLGKELLKQTASGGVDVSDCLISNKHSTASYLAVLNPQGERYFALEDMVLLDEMTPAFFKLKKDQIGQSSLVFVDANLSSKALKSILSYGQRAKIPVCADTASPLLAVRLIPYLDQLAVLTANNREATILLNEEVLVTDRDSAFQAARMLVNRGVGLVIIAMAELGVVYATSETSGHIPALNTQVLDTTGAGDALTATVLFGLLNQIPIDEAVRLGVTAASLILRHRGSVYPGLSLEKLYDELIL
jgi:pseudouridine kinase